MLRKVKNGEYEIFDLVHIKGDPQEIFDLIGGAISDGDASRLRQCFRMAKAVLIEREYIDKDYRNVYSSYYSKKFSEASSRTVRLHLFDVEFEVPDLYTPFESGGLASCLGSYCRTQSAKQADGTTDGYLGYIVVRPTEYSRIGRCLLDPRKVAQSRDCAYARGCLAPYSADILGNHLDVMAFPHQSQDAEVHICAHTALWSLFRYLSQKYANYKEHYPHDIAMLNRDLRHGRVLPSRGLYMDQVAAIFGQFGLGAEMYEESLIGDMLEEGGNGWAAIQPISGPVATASGETDLTRRRKRDDLLHLLHIHLESGLPPVVGVPGHAVVAVGVEYASIPVVERPGTVIPSTDFVKAIIVNDDNHAPYRSALRPSTDDQVGTHPYTCEDIDSLVVPLPDKVFLSAEKVEIIVTDLLEKLGSPSRKGDPGEKLVRHLYCTSSKNYRAFRRRDADAVSAAILRHPLPHFIWVSELSPISSWFNKEGAGIVEIGIDATAGPYDNDPFLWIRHPDLIVINLGRIYGYDSTESQFAAMDVTDGDKLTFSRFTANLRSFND